MIAAPDIKLEAMSVLVDRRVLLKPMDLSVPAGSWCGIVGPQRRG